VKRRVSLRFFFEQIGKGGCGVCAVNTILKKFGLKGVIFPFSPKKGVTSTRILRELRKAGLIAEPKTISIRNLRPWLILWYPPKGGDGGDHYVVIGEIVDGWVLIYDSERKKPYWSQLSTLKKKWYRWYRGRWCGWVIEVGEG
jgi:ABC-type bacteriocin/lantibiotic exporter with double-glycine peptidase domain